MEDATVTKLKSKRKERDKNKIAGDLEGEIPEAPKLQDFQAGEEESAKVKGESSSELSTTTSSEISRVSTSTSINYADGESSVSPENDGNYDAAVAEVLSDCSSVSVGEEAFVESESAPTTMDAGDYHHNPHPHLYPSLSLPEDSALNSLGSLAWENISTPVHSSSSKIKDISFELPLELLPTQLDSKIQHLYSNMILECSEEKVKDFLQGNKTAYDGFELYELLCSYQRAYNQLSSSEKVLGDLRERCTTLEKSLWTVEHQTLSESSTCMDGNVVSASHKYMIAKFDTKTYTQLDKVLKGTKELVKDSCSLFTYSVQLCKTQISHFFHKSFKDVNLQSFEVQGYYSGYPTGELQNCANLLKHCISTLFIFIRKSSTNICVLRDCQKWVGDCVGLLLRIATLDDHLLILNHVLRCPPGMVGKGLAACVQIPKIPIPSSQEEYIQGQGGFSNLNLDYGLTVLKLILNPVLQREEFLTQVEAGIKAVVVETHNDSANQWVVVDSDGEDDPEELKFFKESDLISLLHQVPFDAMFRRILLISKEQGQDFYDVRVATERNVLKLLAFGTQLTNILGEGFVAYYTDRYRQLVKMLGRLILHTVQYITDHIEFLISSEAVEGGECCGQPGSLVRKEYDLFFRNAVGVLFSGKNIGTLQFLAAMPYHLISSEMLWHVYCAITKLPVNDRYKTDISSEFENELVSMNESDAFYLLTTLCNMSTAREDEMDANFTRIVTLHLFQIGFLSPLTRDCCSKNARDLLGNLTRKYPEIISVLLHTINSKMQVLETFSLYLLKELAFDSWKPTDADMKLTLHWLVAFPMSSIENQTARFVIQSMNWGFNADGELFLPFQIHYQVALMIMESNTRWERGQSFISEGMKQINPLQTRGQDNWAWDLLKRLHLHAFDRQNSGSVQFSAILNSMPTFDSNSELECVRKGVESKSPLACFLSLFLTPVGHSVPLICSKGIDLIDVILQNYRLEFVTYCLFFITPLFVEVPDALYSMDKFRNILSVLLAADMTYVRMAKNLISTDFPGEITKLLGDMISAQINQCSRLGTDEKRIIAFWTECLTKLEGWNKDNNVIYLLDVLAKASISREDCHSHFIQYFSEMYKNMPQSSHSGIASLFSWSTPMTSLLPNPPYTQMPYFIYYILSIEMDLENQTGFWKMLCIKLNNPKTTLDAAVKKCSYSTKFATSTNFITIYRWAQLALYLPNSHELTFLTWQKFFLRYFHRVSGNQTTQYSCVASRFFEGMVNTSFYNKLRRKLNDLLTFWKEKMSSFERQDHNLSENASENPVIMKELLTDKINLGNAFVLWIEDIQLLQPTLYLPALAPHFMPTVLLSLMDGEEISWKNYVDFDIILSEERVAARTYMVTICRSGWFDGFKLPRFSDLRISTSNCVEDVLKRLNSYDAPKEPPPVPVFEDIIPTSSPLMFVDVKEMRRGLEPHWKQLKDYSKAFMMQISQLIALNCAYWESLPELYANSPAEMMVNARCSGKSGGRNWENCSGPARVIFKYTETKLNEGLGHQIHQNRTEYQSLLDFKGSKPPPSVVCIAAVFIEDFITNLVMHYRRSSLEGEERIQVAVVGSELFYYAATMVNDDTDFYPPTRQLLSSLLEVLGREFISTLPNQSHRLVTTAIRSPKLVGSFAPHLNLATCQPPMLIDIYREVSSIPKKNVDLAFVILTKFDINNWLKTTKPKLNERSQLIQIIWRTITQDGFSPADDRLMVHDTYRNHLRNMLMFDFPQHYGEILTLILDGIRQNLISPQILYDFCNGLSRDTIRFGGGMDPFLRKREIKRFATEASILEYQELMDTAHLLARHFTEERLANGMYGLYAKFRIYVEALSCLLQMVAYSIVAYSLKNSKGTLSQHNAVWPKIRDLYAPWMLPYSQKFVQQNCAQWIHHINFDAGNVLQPWIANDSQFAMVIVNDFTDCLMFLVETLPGNSTIFSYLWNYYVENFALIGVKEHVVGVVHNCFVSIPWAMYWPTFADVELMCKVVEKFLPASHSFLSIVFAQISWLQWINSMNPKFIGKGHAMLLNLTIRLGNDSVARESPTWMQVMDTAEREMNWLTISPSALEPILNWLVMSIDPRVVLNLDITHRMDKALLRLLETACGYGHPDQLSSNTSCNSLEINTKRYCFVRSYVRLIVSASSKHKNLLEAQPKAFEDAIKNMVTELAVSVKVENQSPDFFISHLRELLGLMSNHTLGTIARNAILEWCNSKDSHSLHFLMTVIQLSCSVKVKPYIVCPLVENVINLCFQYPDATWMSIKELTVVNPEELGNFFDVASKDGHYLFLYSLMLRRFTSFVEGGLDTLCFFMDLLKNLKPKESNEEGVSLIYEELLKVTVQLHLEAGTTNATVLKHGKKFLLMLAQHLSLIGDDKQVWGLLGALGIGKASQLSVRGRLFAKCLGIFVFTQLPNGCGVRIDPGAEGHFTQENSSESAIKPHPETQSCLDKLESLKQSRQHTDLIECIDFAVQFIKEPHNALSSCSLFTAKLNGYLFSSRFLIRS